MALPVVINPYTSIGKEILPGLNAIISAIPVNPSVDDIVDAVVGYVQPIYYPGATPQVVIEIRSVAYNAINSFADNLVLSGKAFYNSAQFVFLQMLIGKEMSTDVATDSFTDRLLDIEENIGSSGLLNVPEQMPLFLCTTIGLELDRYWTLQLANPLSPWLSYFSTNDGQNYSNRILWNVAGMNGALSGYGLSYSSLIDPTINRQGNLIVSSLIAALTVASCKVVFGWIPLLPK